MLAHAADGTGGSVGASEREMIWHARLDGDAGHAWFRDVVAGLVTSS
jgi:hypothetical protein